MIKSIIKHKLFKPILYTVICLLIFKVGSMIPVPGINREVLKDLFSNSSYGMLDLFDMFSGGSFSNFTVFALGVSPYITASIIIQLLTMVFPKLQEMSKDGVVGQLKVQKITKITGIGLALIQGVSIILGLFRSALVDTSIFTFVVVLVTLVGGAAFLIYLSGMIDNYGLGNGMSLLIFAGIISRLPSDMRNIWNQIQSGDLTVIPLIILVIIAFVVLAVVVVVNKGERKIPIQYAQRATKYVSNQSSTLPMKINAAGVVPVIFAISILQVPTMIAAFAPDTKFAAFVNAWSTQGNMLQFCVYLLVEVILIIAFTYFYTYITVDTKEMADNLKNNTGSIKGIRPGLDTIKYLSRVRNNLCLWSALFLAVVAILPSLLLRFAHVSISFGGTSLLIMVGVALELYESVKNKSTTYERISGNRSILGISTQTTR